jgi:hypothetical protein
VSGIADAIGPGLSIFDRLTVRGFQEGCIMTVLLMIVAILGTGSGQPNNPTVGGVLNVTEIGTFDDLAKCKAAIASAYVERKTAAPGPSGSVANIEYQFVCIERGQGED